MEQALSSTAALAFGFSLLSASSLVVGAGVGILLVLPARVVAAIMAFGAGALISALAFELVEKAFEKAGFVPLAIGVLIGGVTFVGLNSLSSLRQGTAIRREGCDLSQALISFRNA